jgi:hypothetical protein
MKWRAPSLEQDGWCLDDGEERHAAAPGTFWIPTLEARRGLYPGCGVKLIFRIATPDGDEVERMWVVVTQRIGDGERYMGVLDNTPYSNWAPGRLEPEFELPFEPRHVIDIDDPCEATMAIAKTEPAKRWS